MNRTRTTSTASTNIATAGRTRRPGRLGLALAAGIAVAAPLAPAIGSAAAAPAGIEDITLEATCPKDGKIDTPDGPASVTVTAPEGMLIAGYCVKAGSANQGDGPETVMLAPPVEEVTFSHSSGKGISPYPVVYVDEPIDDKAPPPDVPDQPEQPQPEQPQPEQPQPEQPQPEQPQPEQPQPEQPQPEQPVVPEAEVASAPAAPTSDPVPAGDVAAELPSTGSTTGGLAVLAGLLSATGGFAMWSSRRRTA